MKMAGSDLRGAVIWMTQPPTVGHHGPQPISPSSPCAPPDEAERGAMKSSLERISDDEVRAPRHRDAVGSLAETDATWSGSIDQQRWQSWVGASPLPPALNYKVDLTNYLDQAHVQRALEQRRRRHRHRPPRASPSSSAATWLPSTMASRPAPARPRRQASAKVMKDLSAAAESARSTDDSLPGPLPTSSPRPNYRTYEERACWRSWRLLSVDNRHDVAPRVPPCSARFRFRVVSATHEGCCRSLRRAPMAT